MQGAQGEGFCPLVADEETEARLNRAAPSPQDRAGPQTGAVRTPDTALLPFQTKPARGCGQTPSARASMEAEVQRGSEACGRLLPQALSGSQPVPSSRGWPIGWQRASDPFCGSQALGWGRPCPACSGAWPSHCFCTFSKLENHCCPFLGKKS